MSSLLSLFGLKRWSSIALVAFVVGTFVAPALRAETLARSSTDSSAEAVNRYREARKAFDAGEYERAIRLFVEADRLAPRAALSFNIARSYEKLGDSARALEHYRRYLRREPSGAGAKRASERVNELESELQRRGVQQVTIDSTPPGAQVAIGERLLGVTPWTGELAPGHHTLILTHAGHTKTTRVIEVSAERALDVEIVLAPQGSASAATGTAPGSDSSERASFKDRVGPWPFVALGASAVAFGVAGAYELERSDAEAAARASRTQVEYAVHRDDAESRETTARVFAGVGGGLALIGGVLFGVGLLDDSPKKPDDEARARLWLDCGATTCTAQFRERF
jgi:tetratricopeptide (TPR) repeat protein